MRPVGIACLLALVLAAACSRPLTSGEKAFARDVFGETLNTETVRVAAGAGLAPPPAARPPVRTSGKIEARPGLCDRNAPGPRTGPPPAMTLYQRVHLSRELYRADTAPGWPDRVLLPHALVMAHELTHVWQWQNRARTGYRPIWAALESVINIDPYFYAPHGEAQFFGFAFEQQASLIEDYLCYALFDPSAAQRAEVRAILAPVFPIGRLDAVLDR